MLRAHAADEIADCIELLTTYAVETLVAARVQIPRLGTCAPEPFDTAAEANVGARADVVIERERQRPAQRFELVRSRLDLVLDRDTGGLRREHVLRGGPGP